MNRRLPAGNLPAEIASFVGRRRELSEIGRLLSTTRLLTVTGVGGVGKTRLALRVGEQLRRVFPDGVWLVELAGLRDAQLLPQAVGNALKFSDVTGRDRTEVLARSLADRQLLLIVDNCEHVVHAVAQLVVALLRDAVGLRVLATSREALQVPGERLYPVAPLPVPPPGASAPAAEYPAVVLFAQRAASVYAGFVVTDDNAALVTEVCRHLDGLPLAIELAAARLRTMSLAQVAERLDDRFRLLSTGNRAAPPRHQTLRAAADWSFELCTEPERLLWMRAAVFAGGFDLAAAERICGGDGLPADTVVEATTALVDKSVLVVAPAADVRRYRLLETLAEYGLNRLRDPDASDPAHGVDEVALRRRHRDFYVELAERFDAGWFGPDQVAWSDRMRAELDNLRAALGSCLAGLDRTHDALRLAGALHYLWYGCGQAPEGRLWLERALLADPAPSPERMRALAAYARILMLQGRSQAAAEVARDVLDLAGRFDRPLYEAEALTVLGADHMYRDDPAGAVAVLERAASLAADHDPAHPQVAYAKVPLAIGLRFQGDVRRAGELLADSQRICHAHGDQWYLGLVLFNSALQALAESDPARALSHGRESLRLRQALHDIYGAASGLDLLAWVAAADRAHVRAARLLGAADGQWQAIGGAVLSRYRLRQEAVATVRAALGDATFEAEHKHGADLTLDDAIGYALGRERQGAEQRGRDTDDKPRLTRRESQIAGLVAEGLTNRQIADRLVISQRTVESHVENVLTKLGFTSRTQIATWHMHH